MKAKVNWICIGNYTNVESGRAKVVEITISSHNFSRWFDSSKETTKILLPFYYKNFIVHTQQTFCLFFCNYVEYCAQFSSTQQFLVCVCLCIYMNVHLCWECVYMCVHLDACAHMYSGVCVEGQRQVSGISLQFSSFFKTGSLTDPAAHWFGCIDWPEIYRDLPVSAQQWSQTYTAICSPLCECWKSEPKSSCMYNKHWWNHLPSFGTQVLKLFINIIKCFHFINRNTRRPEKYLL